MIADTDVEEKVEHIKRLIIQRRRLLQSLHVPKTVDVAMNVDAGEKCAMESVSCQTVMDEMMRYDVGCQTDKNSVAADDLLQHDVGCQTVEKSTKQDVSCQTAELFSNNESDDAEDLNDHDSGIERSTGLNCTDDDKLRDSSENGVTKLLVLNLHPSVTETDLSLIFINFKSYKFSKINYYSTGTRVGTADVVFGERADALKAKKKFNGKMLDGASMTIVFLDPAIHNI